MELWRFCEDSNNFLTNALKCGTIELVSVKLTKVNFGAEFANLGALVSLPVEVLRGIALSLESIYHVRGLVSIGKMKFIILF